MGTKRTAAEAQRPPSPRTTAKRQRAQSGLPRPITSPRPATPAKPPRMPRFDHDQATATADKKLVNRLNRLTAQELLTLVKDVELRFRQLAAFEKEEIRRAQKLGFATANSPLKVMIQTTACIIHVPALLLRSTPELLKTMQRHMPESNTIVAPIQGIPATIAVEIPFGASKTIMDIVTAVD